MEKSRGTSKTPKSNRKQKNTHIDDGFDDGPQLEPNPDAHLNQYFELKNPGFLIPQWGQSFKSNPTGAICELLSFIFQLAGRRYEITEENIEEDSLEQILIKFAENSKEAGFNPPVNTLVKDKTKIFFTFWDEMASQFITCDLLFNEAYSDMQHWLTTMSGCTIRPVRFSSTIVLLSLFKALAQALSRIDQTLNRLSESNNESDLIQAQIATHNKEKNQFTTILKNLNRIAVGLRLRDADSSIRLLTLEYFTEAIIAYPSELSNEQSISLIARFLNDPTPKNRQVGVISLGKIISETNNETVIPDHILRIVEMASDKDNSVVESVLDFLNSFTIPSEVELDSVHALLADSIASIRQKAALFTYHHSFEDISDNTQQFEAFLQFASNFDDEQLPAVVSSLFEYLPSLKDFQMMCDLLISEANMEDSLILSEVLLYASETAAGRLFDTKTKDETLRSEMSVILSANLKKLIAAYKTEPRTLINILQCSRLLDLNSISESMFPMFVAELRNCFVNSSESDVYKTAISVLYELSVGEHQLNEIARNELEHLAVECMEIEGEYEVIVGKLIAAAKFVNMGDSTLKFTTFDRLRDDNLRNVSKSIELLDCLFRWDLWHVRNSKEDNKDKKYMEIMEEYRDNIAPMLNHEASIVRESAIRTFSTLFLHSKMSATQIFTDDCINDFLKAFHRAIDKGDLLESVCKPFEYGVIDSKYSVHILLYIADDLLKNEVNSFFNRLKKRLKGKIRGHELITALNEASMPDSDKQVAARYLVKKVELRDLIGFFFENYDSTLDNIMIYFILQLSQREAEDLKDNSPDTFKDILQALSEGEKVPSSLLSEFRIRRKNPSLMLEESKERPIREDISLEEPTESFLPTRH